ncbi:hypothetical protein SAMN05192583_3701 [Sphingomonas gellani]|uniref:HD domain-containing protein n=2 Tax=Sphingomonas gellani TaxID=1166340 RepID=A0A1H8JXI8_9SPHN|nr:hypothetical protein SAMN05192583_3701 [Sphingomonas gellani]
MYVSQRVRDPIHNLIPFRPTQFEHMIWQVMQTRPFQRLRRIKQLGFSDLVYPGATHSRFAHSVGVFHTARQLMQIIRESVGTGQWNEARANAALAAALVHDVGHGPFSHAFEEVGKRLQLKLAHHEHVSDLLIRESHIAQPLREMGSGFANDVADVIKASAPQTVYDAVVSSQFDADRLDYMRRDRFMAGSSHGVIDYDWLVSNLQVETVSVGVDDQKVGELQTFVIGPKGVYAAEAYVLGLFQLYPTIYFHKATRGVEKLFTEMLVRVFTLVKDSAVDATGLSKDHPLVTFAKDADNLGAALNLDDAVVFGALAQLAEASDPLISEFATRIRDRKLFKCFDIREQARACISSSVNVQEAERMISKISIRVVEKVELWRKSSPEVHILYDKASRPPYKRFDESKGPLNQIMVRTGSGMSDLGEFSPVVNSIPTFEVSRYYFDREQVGVATMLKDVLNEEIKNVL